jgi:3',5'-cyclic AMP phosphodiesterase CpdA
LKGAAIRIDREHHRRHPPWSGAVHSRFGTNFLVADLEGERSGNFRYAREGDLALERIPHFVMRAEPADASVARTTGYHDRRIYMRRDNLFISRIDYFDAKAGSHVVSPCATHARTPWESGARR